MLGINCLPSAINTNVFIPKGIQGIECNSFAGYIVICFSIGINTKCQCHPQRLVFNNLLLELG